MATRINIRRTAIIYYTSASGQPAKWRVGCTSQDDEKSMREHATKWFPNMVVTGVAFEFEEKK